MTAPNPSVTPHETPDPRRPKTPADFQTEAGKINDAVQLLQNERVDLERRAADLMANRETLISSAGEFGCTSKYARAYLRKP